MAKSKNSEPGSVAIFMHLIDKIKEIHFSLDGGVKEVDEPIKSEEGNILHKDKNYFCETLQK